MENDFHKESFHQFRDALPYEAKIASVSEDSFISETTQHWITQLYMFVGRTLDNIKPMLLASEIPHFKIYPFVNVRNLKFHASASLIDENQGVVAFNSGVIFSILDACSMVSNAPEFLSEFLPDTSRYNLCNCPHCGKKREFSGWLTDYSWLATLDENSIQHWQPMKMKTSLNPRTIICDFLVRRCLFWICSHEVGHLLLDHLAFLNRDSISESEENDGNNKNLRHILEIEADLFASISDVDIYRLTRQLSALFEDGKRKSNYKGEWPTPTPDLAARLISVVSTIVGMIFAHLTTKDTITHPSPRNRITLTHGHVEDLLKKKFGANLSKDSYDMDFAIIGAYLVNNNDLRNEYFQIDHESLESLIENWDSFQSKNGLWYNRLSKIGIA